MKTLTHAQKIRQENLQIKGQVQSLVGFNNHQYCHFQEAMGYKYLDDEMGLKNPLVKQLAYTQEFWNWFKNQWVKRDIQFLKDVMEIGSRLPLSIYAKAKIQDTYMQYHKSDAILFSPHKAIMRESYSRMIGKLNKRVVNG